jgi:hypothetical protein
MVSNSCDLKNKIFGWNVTHHEVHTKERTEREEDAPFLIYINIW